MKSGDVPGLGRKSTSPRRSIGMLQNSSGLKNGQSKPRTGRGRAGRSGRQARFFRPRAGAPYDPSLLLDSDDQDEGDGDSQPAGDQGASAGGVAEQEKHDLATAPDTKKIADESFLVVDDESDVEPAPQADADEVGEIGWFKSEAYGLVSRMGSADVPGNFKIGVPLWCLWYFAAIETAVVFSQILYWFLRAQNGRIRIRRWDGKGRPVIDKTHRQLADELGVRNARRIEKALKTLKADGLLDYDPRYGTGKGRTTRIWLIPEGVQRAYLAGCERLDKMR
jgi:hypothetical protein